MDIAADIVLEDTIISATLVIGGGSSGGGVGVEDEGITVVDPASTINFVGSGVTATDAGGGVVDVTIAAGGAPIDTVFGRTGTVVAVSGDYDADQIDETASGKILTSDERTAIALNTLKETNATHVGDVTGSTALTIANDAVTLAKIADAALSGDDDTIITGTAGTSGNVPEFNADGDIIDSGKASSAIGSGGGGGETNTSSNDGGGVEVAKTKDGEDLPFRTFNSTEFEQSTDIVQLKDAGVADTKLGFNPYDMSLMVESGDEKILTSAERTKINDSILALIDDGSPELSNDLETGGNDILIGAATIGSDGDGGVTITPDTGKTANCTGDFSAANLSGTNTGDQDLSGLALKSNVLELDNTDAFTPDADYEPATKKYVDDNVGGGGGSLEQIALILDGADAVITAGMKSNMVRIPYGYDIKDWRIISHEDADRDAGQEATTGTLTVVLKSSDYTDPWAENASHVSMSLLAGNVKADGQPVAASVAADEFLYAEVTATADTTCKLLDISIEIERT